MIQSSLPPEPVSIRFRSQNHYLDSLFVVNATVQDGLRCKTYLHVAPQAYRRLPWSSLGYFRCASRVAKTPHELDTFLEGLTTALTEDEARSLVVLRASDVLS